MRGRVMGVAALLASAAAGDVIGSEVGGDLLVRIDVSARSGLPIGSYSDGSFNLNGLDGDAATGRAWGIDAASGRLYEVNAATGWATAISDGLFGNNANGLAYDSIRERLWISNNAGQLSWYDLATGQHGMQGNTGLDTLEGLAFDASTGTLYALRDADNRIYSISTVTLSWSAISPNLASGNWRGLAFDPTTGRLVASRVGATTYLAEFDPVSGEVVSSGDVAGVGAFVQGLAFVPAPGSAMLLGLGALVLVRRGRQSSGSTS